MYNPTKFLCNTFHEKYLKYAHARINVMKFNFQIFQIL